MEKDYVKRYFTKDGKQRITIKRHEYAGNPRYNTDEPLHCEDWSRDYSIMTKQEREYKIKTASERLRWIVRSWGDEKKIVSFLIENGKKDGEVMYDNRLVYNRSKRGWELQMWYKPYNEEIGWYNEDCFYCKRDEIDFCGLVEELSDETIDYIVKHFMTDGVKMASYGFGYNGEISFSDEISCDSEGICWLEKDEFLKYSRCKEEYWKSKTFKEIEFLCDDIEAWGDDEVYGFCVEKAVRRIVNVRYPDGEHDDTETEETEWEEIDSCWGFYGELSKSEEWILSDTGFKKEDLIEE